MAVTMALDVGEKRIGVAVSDELGILARPLTTVVYARRADAIGQLHELVVHHAVGKLVVGLPKTLRNEIGPQAQRVLRFVDALKENVRVPVETWDERLTTVEASRKLRETSKRGRRRRGPSRHKHEREQLDAAAAAVLLESYLDAVGSQSTDR